MDWKPHAQSTHCPSPDQCVTLAFRCALNMFGGFQRSLKALLLQNAYHSVGLPIGLSYRAFHCCTQLQFFSQASPHQGSHTLHWILDCGVHQSHFHLLHDCASITMIFFLRSPFLHLRHNDEWHVSGNVIHRADLV